MKKHIKKYWKFALAVILIILFLYAIWKFVFPAWNLWTGLDIPDNMWWRFQK